MVAETTPKVVAILKTGEALELEEDPDESSVFFELWINPPTPTLGL